MALATRCPNCQALFRVVADQLKLRGGLVRCGACRHVFDAIGSLAYIDDSTASPAPAAAQRPAHAASPAATPAPPPPAPPERRRDEHPAERAADRRAESPRAQKAPPPSDERSEPPEDRLAVPTLLASHSDATVDLTSLRAEAPRPAEDEDDADGKAGAEAGDEDAADAPEEPRAERRRQRSKRDAQIDARVYGRRIGDAAVAEAPTEPPDEEDEDAPEFLRDERERRGFSVIYGGGSIVLAVLLVLQAMILFRTELVTRWPGVRPTLISLCKVAGCTVGWPTRAELLAVVGTELQAIPGTEVLELRTVIRNRAPFTVALPAIEVALTDTQNRTIARKVFAPVDYLASAGEPASRIDEGLAPGSDYEVRLAFEARGVPAVGFVVYPFYL